MIHEEISREIIGCAYAVMNEMGSGFLESVYENALVIALETSGLQVVQQRPIDVRFRGRIVGNYVADLIVEDRILLELKAVKTLLPEHKAQVINYLKATGYPLGLLINFGNPKVEIHRLFPKAKPS